MRIQQLFRLVVVLATLVLSKSQENATDTPTLTPTALDDTAAPTVDNTTMPVAQNSTAPSMAPFEADGSSPAPSFLNDTDAPTMMGTTTAPVMTPTDEGITESPVVSVTEFPTKSPVDIHDKDKILDPKSKDTKQHGVGNDGISASAIFGIVIAVGLVFVGAFFVFGKSRGGGRRDGMREMEMSTWVNNNDDGLL